MVSDDSEEQPEQYAQRANRRAHETNQVIEITKYPVQAALNCKYLKVKNARKPIELLSIHNAVSYELHYEQGSHHDTAQISLDAVQKLHRNRVLQIKVAQELKYKCRLRPALGKAATRGGHCHEALYNAAKNECALALLHVQVIRIFLYNSVCEVQRNKFWHADATDCSQ